jgi:hypothetical protein
MLLRACLGGDSLGGQPGPVRLAWRWVALRRWSEDRQQLPEGLSLRELIGHGKVGMNGVVVAAPVAATGQVAGGDEFVNDPVRGALSDPDALCDLAQADRRILEDAEQNARVVGEKRPSWPVRGWHQPKEYPF